jgi:hypothetical protein
MNGFIRRGAIGVVLLSLPWTLSADDVTMTNQAGLAFGSLISGSTTGTVTVSSSGATSTTGGVIAFGGGSAPASFSISIDKGYNNYTIQLPGTANLTGPGVSMVVNSFESTPGSGSHSRTTQFVVMKVGATLSVPANQVAGSYNGTFQVTVHGQ